MRYRSLKAGEIVEATDEYMSFFGNPGAYSPVARCTVGQAILDCNTPYYRRPIQGAIAKAEVTP